jgi:hypothetical protein
MPKLNYSWKHVGQKKATIANGSVTMKELYVLKTNQHVVNENLYVQRGMDYFWQ